VRRAAISWIIFLISEVAVVACRDLPPGPAPHLSAAPSLAEPRDNFSMIVRVDLVLGIWPTLAGPALAGAASNFGLAI
jgi:hypothetical protein